MEISNYWLDESYTPSMWDIVQMAYKLKLIKTSRFRSIRRYYIAPDLEYIHYESYYGHMLPGGGSSSWTEIILKKGRLRICIYDDYVGSYILARYCGRTEADNWKRKDYKDQIEQLFAYLLYKIRRKLSIMQAEI